MEHRRIEREGDGYALRLSAGERQLMRSLPGQLRELLHSDDPSLVRLFPPAYDLDQDADAEFGLLVHGDLLDDVLGALIVVEETADAERLDEAQLGGWLRALESLRLVLGTRLDVTEAMLAHELDPADPHLPELELYGYLSWLQEQAVEALSAGLP
jgi:Domain of unknown function (DUF2017)